MTRVASCFFLLLLSTVLIGQSVMHYTAGQPIDLSGASAVKVPSPSNASDATTKTYVDAGLSGKQNALGFTAENSANKDTDGTLAANSDTRYASQKATKAYADTKQAALGFTAENSSNKDNDTTLASDSTTKYPTQHAAKAYADTKGATTNQNIREILGFFDNGGLPLTGPLTRCRHVDYAGTIQKVVVLSDVTGSAVIDVQTVAYASWNGAASGSSITASAKPTLSSANKYSDTGLSGWTTSVTADTDFCFVLSSPATITWASIVLKVAAN